MCSFVDKKADLALWWTELWTEQEGATRVYCGVARTDEGFAVDLFRDYTCVLSEPYRTEHEAVMASMALQQSHRRAQPTAAYHAGGEALQRDYR